ncbi:hypothetical protein JJD61_07095 [Pseudomonas carnis]|uniref:hypothetical protein n=1 Tax=Pseudomonas carnis TaxID=2487355 RepID=UPI00190CD9AD|nr:hypothetical protein [Pseudomonas carnis]MBK3470448.1 hypothetical protein [Pseudomonas carnis]
MRYNTGNPVGTDGSSDPRDLYDNAGVADLFANGLAASFPDRLDRPRKSIYGMEQDFSDFLLRSGFESAYVLYAAGAVVQRPTQLIERAGELYRVTSQADLPLTLTGVWATDQAKLTAVGDQAIRQLLAGDSGASNVSYKRDDVGSIKRTIQQALDNRNTYLFEFGGVGDGIADDTDAWEKALSTGKAVDGLGKTYKISRILEIPSQRMIMRANFIQAGGSVDNMSMLQMTGLGGVVKENIHFYHVHLNGNREAQTNIGFGASGDGERHGFYIKGRARNILFSHCSAKNCATDGLCLFGAAASVTFAIEGVVIDQCTFNKCRRHGVAFDTLYKLRAYGGDWFDNGNDLPGAAGKPITSGWYGARVGGTSGPQYGNGCDIEGYGADNFHSTQVEDVEFHGVNMVGNYSGGLKILSMPGDDYEVSPGVFVPGYNHPNWRPMKNIKVFGGVYDEGVSGTPSSETSPIQVGSAGLLPIGKYGMVDLFVYAARCASSIMLNNTNRAHIQASIGSVNGGAFPYHAFIQRSDNINLQLSTDLLLAVYEEDSSVTKNKPIISRTKPSLAASGGTLSSQSTTLVTSDLQSGQVYRINAGGALTLAVGSLMQLDIAGGRTILDVQGSYLNTVTSEIRPVFYRASGGYVLMRPDTQAPLEIVLYVTVA